MNGEQDQSIHQELQSLAADHCVMLLALERDLCNGDVPVCPLRRSLFLQAIGACVLIGRPVIGLRMAGCHLTDKMIAICDRYVDFDPNVLDWDLVNRVRLAIEDLKSMEADAT